MTGREHCKRVVFLPEQAGHASAFLEAYLERRQVRTPGPGVRIIPKAWGEEWVFADEPAYTGKLLRVLPRSQSSVHRHGVKDETFLVLAGELQVMTFQCETLVSPVVACWQRHVVLRPGEAIRIEPGVWHRWANAATSGITEFVEASTRHEETDTERAIPSGPFRVEDWA